MTSIPPPLLNQDAEHLRLLAIFHYILGGLGALFACFPLIHVIVGLMIIRAPEALAASNDNPPPAFVGYLFFGMGLLFVLIGWATAICAVISGRCLAQQKRRVFSMVVAGVLCAFVPLGTVLGVFTLIALNRDSVRRLYSGTPDGA